MIDTMAHEENLNEILQKAQKGDNDAFRFLYDKHWPSVLFVCEKLCKNPEDAKDIMQDTFFKAYQKMHQVQDVEKFKPWLITIATNEYYQQVRKKQVQTYEDDEVLENIAEMDESFLPEIYVEKKESYKFLIDIIDGLPEKQREAVYLHYYADMTVAEIASSLRCSENSVTNALFKARRNIKIKLEEEEEKSKNPPGLKVTIPFALMAEQAVAQKTTEFAAAASFTAVTAAIRAAKVTSYLIGRLV